VLSAFIAAFSFALMVVINALANILPINGQNTGAVSEKYDTLFAPAGLTFSIWGLIYFLLFIHVLYHIYNAFIENNEANFKANTSWLFSLSCILNSLWIFAWHYEFLLLSVFIIIALLVTLAFLFMQTDSIKPTGIIQHIALKTPFSIYLGWISVAVIANISTYLVSIKWNAFYISEDIWAMLLIIIAAILALLMLLNRKNASYALVVIWALSGIILKRNNSTPLHQDIITVSYFCTGIIFLLIITQTFFTKKKSKNKYD